MNTVKLVFCYECSMLNPIMEISEYKYNFCDECFFEEAEKIGDNQYRVLKDNRIVSIDKSQMCNDCQNCRGDSYESILQS